MTPEQQLHELRERRDRSVRAARGPLALVRTAWLDGRTEIEGIPGVWAPTVGGDGVALTATAADGLHVDGTVVDGTVALEAAREVRIDESRTATVATVTGRPAVRVWDSASPRSARFLGIDAYPYDAAWVLRGTFEAVDGGVAFTHGRSQGGDDAAVSPGIVHVEHAGHSADLVALPDGDRLQIVFADATTGDETYGVGRFLYVQPHDDGSVELDWNRAIVPPCSMSDQFNCPLPPAQNRLPYAVTAGERMPRFADGA